MTDNGSDRLPECRNTDTISFEALYHQYQPLIHTIVAKYYMLCNPRIPEERRELEEEACIALFYAQRTYHDDRGVTFGLYAKICIRNRLISYLRRQHPVSDSIDDTELPNTDMDPETTVLSREAFKSLSDSFLSSLTVFEASVFRLYITGASYEVMAKKLSVPLKSIDNAVYRMRVKLKKAISNT